MNRPTFKRLRFTEKSIPWLFALLVGLAYGLLLFQTGFYWDDWPFAWAAHFMGPENFLHSFVRVRPFLGPIFWLTTSLLPATPLAWQVFALLIRFLLTLAAWWAFRSLWPEHPWQTLLAALCFLVYPGYSQHWVALTHINQELIPLLFYLLSFGMTGLALRSVTGRNRRTTLALVLLALGIFPTEYFISLEPLRFLFILSILSEQDGKWLTRFWRAFKTWLPYLMVWAANALWLYFYYRSGIYANYDVVAVERAPSAAGILADFLGTAIDAILQAGLYAWVQLPLLAARTLSAPSTWVALGVLGLALGLLLVFFERLELALPFSASQKWAFQAVLIGLAGMLLGRVPSWAAGLRLTLGTIFDRFTVSMLPGAALLMAGLLTLLFRKQRAWFVAASLVFALGAGQQFYNANVFRHDWERQRQLYWQFAWRIPALKPGTVLLTDELQLDYETDYSITAPLNWIYAPDFHAARLPYLVLGVGERAGRLPSLAPGVDFQFAYRPVRFYGNTSQAVTFIAPSSSCLRILDPVYAAETVITRQSPLLPQLIQLSDPALIVTEAPAPPMPVEVFGAEPLHTWCYYYTSAELARQRGDWTAVAQLGSQAQKLGFNPTTPVEWLPFIEAYATTGQMEKAEKLSQLALETPAMRKGICGVWARVAQKQPIRDGLLDELGCQ